MSRPRCVGRALSVLVGVLGLAGCVRLPFSEQFLEPPDLKEGPERLSIPEELGLQSDAAAFGSPTPSSDDQFLADGFAAPGPPPLPDLPEPENPLNDEGLAFGSIPEAQLADQPLGQRPRPLRPASEVGKDVPSLAMSSRPASLERSELQKKAEEQGLPPESWPLPARIAMAWRSYYDASPAQALPMFAALTQEAPDRADIRVGLGRCLIARGELEEAYEVLEVARTLATSGDPEPEFYLGLVAYQRGHFREASSRWTGLISLLDALPPGPLHRDHAWLLARARLEMGDRVGGEDAFRRALRVGGELPGGRLSPPPLELEYLPDGRLPASQFLPVAARGPLQLDPPLLVGYEGRIWRLAGASHLLERLTEPNPGWQDLAPVPLPLPQPSPLPLPLAPALPPSSTELGPTRGGLIFLSRDPEGRTFLLELRPDGQRILLLPDPVEPVSPAVSPDGTLVAFVRLVPVGEEGLREPRLFLLRRTSRDIMPVVWPGRPVGEPAFTSLGSLVFPVEEDHFWQLVRLNPGAEAGEILPGLPLVRPVVESALREAAVQRIHDPARAPLPARLKPPVVPAKPMRLDEPWLAPELAPALAPELAPELAPALAPERERPAASKEASGAAVSSTANTSPAVSAGGEGDARQPVASRDPQSGVLLYVRVAGAQRSIRLYDEALRQETQLSTEGSDCYAPTLSASGQWAVWLCRNSGHLEPIFWHRQTGQTERVFGLPLRPGDSVGFER